MLLKPVTLLHIATRCMVQHVRLSTRATQHVASRPLSKSLSRNLPMVSSIIAAKRMTWRRSYHYSWSAAINHRRQCKHCKHHWMGSKLSASLARIFDRAFDMMTFHEHRILGANDGGKECTARPGRRRYTRARSPKSQQFLAH